MRFSLTEQSITCMFRLRSCSIPFPVCLVQALYQSLETVRLNLKLQETDTCWDHLFPTPLRNYHCRAFEVLLNGSKLQSGALVVLEEDLQ